jgi:hypothetical protein
LVADVEVEASRTATAVVWAASLARGRLLIKSSELLRFYFIPFRHVFTSIMDICAFSFFTAAIKLCS